MLHKKVDSVFFGRNRIRIGVRDLLQDLHIHNIQFVAAGCSLVSADFTFDDHTRFLGETFHGIEYFRRHCVLGHHTLDRAGAVTKNGK